jgi:hypothetical protein
MGPKKKTPTFEEGGEDWKTVLRKFRTGEYDVASLKASNIRALERWENKYTDTKAFNLALQKCANKARMEELDDFRHMQYFSES